MLWIVRELLSLAFRHTKAEVPSLKRCGRSTDNMGIVKRGHPVNLLRLRQALLSNDIEGFLRKGRFAKINMHLRCGDIFQNGRTGDFIEKGAPLRLLLVVFMTSDSSCRLQREKGRGTTTTFIPPKDSYSPTQTLAQVHSLAGLKKEPLRFCLKSFYQFMSHRWFSLLLPFHRR